MNINLDELIRVINEKFPVTSQNDQQVYEEIRKVLTSCLEELEVPQNPIHIEISALNSNPVTAVGDRRN